MTPLPRVAAIAATALLLAACSGDPEPEPTPTPTATATPSASPSPTPTPEPATGPSAPLTGLPTEDDEVQDRFVLAVKVENSSASRPQSGLEDADIVFEELVEGGLTRFVALFQSVVPDVVGPIRSARLVDVELLPAYDGVLAISGARDQVLIALSSADVPVMADGTGFFREPSRRAPHNLYASGEDLFARAASFDAPAASASWTFDDRVPAGHVDCDDDLVCLDVSLDVSFAMSRQSSTGWTYDEDAGLYRRSQNGRPFLTTGEGRIGAANVVVLAMDVGDGACCDSNGSPLVRTTVLGQGRAVILRDGHWYEARWQKAARDEPLEFVDEDGKRFPLKPGPTWVHLAPAPNVPDAP